MSDLEGRRKQCLEALRTIEAEYRKACQPWLNELIRIAQIEPRPYIMDADGMLRPIPRSPDVPQEVLDAQRVISEYFKRQNIQSWELGEIQSRR